jgi:hypothetical protein
MSATEHTFAFPGQIEGEPDSIACDRSPRNAHAIRDAFLRVKTPIEALGFLSDTGEFSPLSNTITWSNFLKWQRIAYLVQEHEQLASALAIANWNSECGEVLKALMGSHEGSFFESSGFTQTLPIEDTPEHRQKEYSNAKLQRIQELRWRKLWSWFLNPPHSTEWIPNSQEAKQKLLKMWNDERTGLLFFLDANLDVSPGARGGALIEFLLPKEERQKVILVRPNYTLQAIAAAIFADKANGVGYKKCGWEKCNELIRIGLHKDKLYCGDRCKGNAHQKRKRAK